MNFASAAPPPTLARELTPWTAIFAPAAQSASAALSRWTSGRVALELDQVSEIGMDQLAEILPPDLTPSIMVIVSITGELGGQLILILEEDAAQSLVQSLLNRPIKEVDLWGELEWSALRETGNICASAFLSAIRPFAEQTVLLPSAPTTVRDFVSCVIEQAVMPQLIENDSLLLCQTRMTHLGEAIGFTSLFAPTPQLIDALRAYVSKPRTP